jgi:pSer/pThr/pTyr-binding forkhead associated (FHA) protein
MQVTFEHLTGSKKGQVEQINAERITIGRNPDNLLAFDPQADLDVSGSHAALSDADGGRLMLTDLGSRNGTFLNGKQIAGATLVESGSKVKFGANGPEVKLEFTSGPKKPGATRVMLAQVQQQMEAERSQAASSKKKLMIALVVVGVLGVGGVVGYGMVSSAAAKKKAATTAKAEASSEGERAKRKQANIYARAEFTEAETFLKEAEELFAKGEWVKAEEKFAKARKGFEQASDKAVAAEIAKTQKEAETRLAEITRRAEAQQQELLDQMRKQQEEYEAAQAKKDRENAERVRKLQADMEKASAADRAKMQAELDKLNKQPTSEAARKIIQENETSIVLIYAESYFQAKGSTARTPIAKLEATGFAVGKDMIATAKHVVRPWVYDPKVLATAKKLKEEQGFDIQDYVEIYVKGPKGWEKKFDTASGSAKILKVMADRLEEKTQAVEIEWNQQVTAVPGIQPHKKNIDDLALISVPGGNMRPVSLGDGSAEKFDNVIVLGTVRNADNKLISVSPARAEVQTKGDTVFSINATVPASFGGCPVFKYDGSVWGIVAGPEAQNLICHPISMVKKLQGGGGGSTIKPGQSPGAGAPGGAAPEEEDE